eukprot:scaffold461_cov131-Isochrysis_galbana.AAC.2
MGTKAAKEAWGETRPLVYFLRCLRGGLGFAKQPKPGRHARCTPGGACGVWVCGCDVPRGGIGEWRKDLGEACAAGCADERDAREAVARHLTDGGDPPGTAELSGEEAGEAGEGTRWCAALPLWRPAEAAADLAAARRREWRPAEASPYWPKTRARTLPRARRVPRTKNQERRWLIEPPLYVPADGGFGVEVAGLALVVGVDGAGTLCNSPAAVGASGGGKVGPSPRKIIRLGHFALRSSSTRAPGPHATIGQAHWQASSYI